MEMEVVLRRAIEVRASDIFVVAGLPLTYKSTAANCGRTRCSPPPTPPILVEGIYALCGRDVNRCAAEDADDDFSFAIPHLAASGPTCCTSAAALRWCCG